MNIFSHIRKTQPFGLRSWGMLLILATGISAHINAQITIGGNVYGGGDMGNVGGNTTVHVLSGNLGTDNVDNPGGSVFGGARMADIAGNAFVNIDGQTAGATDYMVINRVYGGNDISGHIGTSKSSAQASVPSELAQEKTAGKINDSWDAFVHISNHKDTTGTGTTQKISDAKKIYIGQLFGGGNGDYYYSATEVVTGTDTIVTHKIYKSKEDSIAGNAPIVTKATPKSDTGFNAPELDKTIINIHGGSIVYAYGGGNKATVSDTTIICMDNPSDVVNEIKVNATTLLQDTVSGQNILTSQRFKAMGINTGLSKPSSDEYQIGRMFGGNNLAEMAIQPKWYLEAGKVRNLYSGGNKGSMTHIKGLLLDIDPDSTDLLIIDNVYGGSRMADVRPLKSGTIADGTAVDAEDWQIQLDATNTTKTGEPYAFPAGLSARVIVRGGKVNNVYGGNDVTGHVTGGNAVGIYTSISGDVYGGGNGSYPYTDKAELINSDIYSDLYYTIPDGKTSAQAMNDFRPDAEQVSIHLMGKVGDTTKIGGSVYCGGNSATLRTSKSNPKVELKIGSYVIADNVFMGNNGENLVDKDILKLYSGWVGSDGKLITDTDGKPVDNPTGGIKFSSIDLTDSLTFSTYMEGAAMSLMPSVSFDSREKQDRYDYLDYSSYIGSLFMGGNVGSMTYPGKLSMSITAKAIIYDKIVGGCNNAYVVASDYNAAYDGGILGDSTETVYTENGQQDGPIKDRVELSLNGPRIQPMRWNDEKTSLVWNTAKWDDATDEGFIAIGTNEEEDDINRRLLGGNIYGGCYNSGHVNGNIIININGNILERYDNPTLGLQGLFAEATPHESNPDSLVITGDRNSGVILDEQSFDVNAIALSVFGGGKGEHTEVWGSSTINFKSGYALQMYGGGEHGAIGRGVQIGTDSLGYPIRSYAFDERYSTTVNLRGATTVYTETDAVPAGTPESEYLYGAGNEGIVSGNSYVYLGNGYIYDAFGGASNADIMGHTEVYVGRQKNDDGSIIKGFPFVRDIVYGGNDFSGTIYGDGDYNMASHLSDSVMLRLNISDYSSAPNYIKTPRAYIEYLQGRVDTIFGGSYGNYPYDDPEYFVDGHKVSMPYLHNSFVNFRPEDDKSIKGPEYSTVNLLFGGSTGYHGSRDGDKFQDHSYVLIDVPYTMDNFRYTQIFGSGSFCGLGMRESLLPGVATQEELEEATARIDLIRGKVGAAYGGSYNEGITRRTMVNVPSGSTINIGSIFGGAYGNVTLDPCDVYEAHVEYHSSDAWLYYDPARTETVKDEQGVETQVTKGNELMKGAIFGGNNNRRRTLYSQINIDVPVRKDSHYDYIGKTTANVFGAGYGENTWSEYTEVNLNRGASVYEVYGGGHNGLVINASSIQKYIQDYYTVQGLNTDNDSSNDSIELAQWKAGWLLGSHYEDSTAAAAAFEYFGKESHFYESNQYTNLDNPLVTERTELDSLVKLGVFKTNRFNTNVIINEGAYVANYAYGGGLGHRGTTNLVQSGNIYGTTYIALLGGTVKKDIYAAGTTGAIYDAFQVGAYDADNNQYGYTASANAYIKGGIARNVYGGGWEGDVGYSEKSSTTNDIPGETNVVIGGMGIPEDSAATTHYLAHGVPAIQRNAYAGGEGGSVIGNANITVYNGRVGYVYLASGKKQDAQGYIVDATAADGDKYNYARYEEKINDETNWSEGEWRGKQSLADCGNVFGSGYDDMSSVDNSFVTIYGGRIRNSVFGGGEIATVGRGTNTSNDNNITIIQPGQTHIYMYNGYVERNIFGGGKGYNALGYGGGHNLHTDGYVFGKTDVNIRGGEIGTENGVAMGYGNVFGGGDQGYVFSAEGKKDGTRYDDGSEGYYYKWDDEHNTWATVGGSRVLTQDCNVLVEPWLEVTAANGINYEAPELPGKTKYAKGEYIPTSYLNGLKSHKTNPEDWSGVDAGTVDLANNIKTERGVKIHNAVFAGGNVSSGKALNANTSTVLGNATATINDAYHRDFITVGTGHTGGLYGDGNLTFVDGYRELNITNYGTDYYNMMNDMEISYADYEKLLPREQAYYEVKYKCISQCTDKENTTYRPQSENSKASTITFQEMLTLFLEFDSVQQKMVSLKATYTANNSNIECDILKPSTDGRTWVPNDSIWEQNGVCSIYAGRIMNTMQRADFCGVWGSRMVMQGAQDRVPETADYTNYTINRVREVSLNKKESTIASDATDVNLAMHGNYFGIYNIVNYLGALSSDVDFGNADVDDMEGDIRVTDKETMQIAAKIGSDSIPYGEATYSIWKKANYKNKSRNNGNSHNKVALASGVYLELTTEKSTGNELYEKDWGIITGVIELDLINVSSGVGGGFVYAKNVHGVRSSHTNPHPPVIALNQGAVSKDDFQYASSGAEDHWEASGNFVHSQKDIIDDCYNIGGRYYGENAVPAHYWYIKGEVYIYDQYISAYSGSPNAYSETVDIPLTITTASYSELKLVDVQPNRYALYSNASSTTGAKTKLQPGQKLVVNDVTYYLNDPINYWDWSQLTKAEQALFEEETYLNIVGMSMDTPDKNASNYKYYEAGDLVLTRDEYLDIIAQDHSYWTADGDTLLDGDKEPAGNKYVFRSSNNINNGNGYILTFDINNPNIWDKWYTPIASQDVNHDKVTTAQYNELTSKVGYIDGPTYTPYTSGLYGRRNYKLGDIITKSEYTKYASAYKMLSDQSGYADTTSFEPAYLTTEYVEASPVGTNELQHLQKGAKLAMSEYSSNGTWPAALNNKVEPAYVCTSTIKLSENQFIVAQELMTETERNQYITNNAGSIETMLTNANIDQSHWEDIKNGNYEFTDAEQLALGRANLRALTQLISLRGELTDNIVPAYYCVSKESDGILFGGDWYDVNKNYRAMDVWSSMTPTDRDNFYFNYDALDLLIDSTFANPAENKFQYDGKTAQSAAANPAGYSTGKSVDFIAIYTGLNPITYQSQESTENSMTTKTISTRPDTLNPTQYARVPNEKRHYTKFEVPAPDTENNIKVYIVNTSFLYAGIPYAVGQTISQEAWDKLPDTEKSYVTTFEFSNSDTKGTAYYYCREDYIIGMSNDSTVIYGDDDQSIVYAATKAAGGNTQTKLIADATDTIRSGDIVPKGYVIDADAYANLVNKQVGFEIQGVSPKENSTLYVSRNSDINDLSKEKIITVIYRYDYEEYIDEKGENISALSERHVLNIHIQFQSGIPTIPDISAPAIILPGEMITLREPNVTPGAYEIIGSGWELFEAPRFAENHTNGKEYTPNTDPLYWYEDGYYVAYYAKTYLGKHYSNHVPVSVANYHDLKEVMEDNVHLHVDHEVKRPSKIYINDYTGSGTDGVALLKDFYELSLVDAARNEANELIYGDDGLLKRIESGPMQGSIPLANSSNVRAGSNLEFILNTNIYHPADTIWEPIGTDTYCFGGNLHGDGYTINGLTNSLFGNLCGDVYNLGVTGSFTGAGIADKGKGYIENSWISTTAATRTAKPILGNPTRTEHDDYGELIQIVNSYYLEEEDAPVKYETHDGSHGTATPKGAQAFYNGEVAFNLNGFYLNRRYYNSQNLTSGTPWRYIDSENNNSTQWTDIWYPENADANYGYLGYVERRYKDGDFRYASGIIPSGEDKHKRVKIDTLTTGNVITTTQEEFYAPIWPNDYLFFGQDLTYGWVDGRPHQNNPSHFYADNITSNRVYRAPAYYGNDTMSVAYFNPNAVMVATNKTTGRNALPGLTAIDFTGYNDEDYSQGLTQAQGKPDMFYAPLLDSHKLTGFRSDGQTLNLLAYSDNANDMQILGNYFNDQNFDIVTSTEANNAIAKVTAQVRGHLVKKQGNDYVADNDHLLVDMNDFNAPIEYTFINDGDGEGHYMWYQRNPNETSEQYIKASHDGWQTISLPFTAEMVTTNQKGEITHFYSGSNNGHEYWLRELEKVNATTNEQSQDVLTSIFRSLSSQGGVDKTDANLFLYKHYYSQMEFNDLNGDDYYNKYYGSAREYNPYPLLQAGKPYLIGFPGSDYYEFDLSGQWKPYGTQDDSQFTDNNDNNNIGPQTITFVSLKNATIHVSDDEYLNDAATVENYGSTSGNYTFHTNYKSDVIDSDKLYLLNTTGNKFLKGDGTQTAKTLPFRPYFTEKQTNNAPMRAGTRADEINIGYLGDYDDLREHATQGGLNIYSQNMNIIVESTLEYETQVTIYTVAGKLLKRFNIKPATKVTVPVNSRGVYIVNRTKIAVTK